MIHKIISKNLKTVIKSFPIQKVQLNKDEITFFVNNNYLKELLLFIKLHYLCQYKILTCISGVDYPKKQNRFEIIYEFLSVKFNNRIKIKVYSNQLSYIESCENIYPSAGWYECEIFDMFGVFFINHNNLKRILTDYGFEGYPLRKDFPLSGYVELRYDDQQKKIINEHIELAQEYRTFDFYGPWNLNEKINI